MQVKIINCTMQENNLAPLMGTKVQAGFPSPAMDYMEEAIDLAKLMVPHPLSTFYVEATGDSMTGAFIPPKSILVVDKSKKAINGDIVIAFVNGDYTVKYFRKRNNTCELVPANKEKNYPIIQVNAEIEVLIWGVVTHIVTDTKNVRACMP